MNTIAHRVPAILESAIASSGLLKKQVAYELGFKRTNQLSNILAGTDRLPMKYIVPLARLLQLDVKSFTDQVLSESYPEVQKLYHDVYENTHH